MHLGDALAVAGHAEGDDVHEVFVVVDARPLAELIGRLDRHRVEVERVDEHPVDVVVGAGIVHVEIEPEEAVAGDRLLDRRQGGVYGLLFLVRVPFMAMMFGTSPEVDAPGSGSTGPVRRRPRRRRRASIAATSAGGRAEPALDVGEAVADHRELLADGRRGPA